MIMDVLFLQHPRFLSHIIRSTESYTPLVLIMITHRGGTISPVCQRCVASEEVYPYSVIVRKTFVLLVLLLT